MYFPTTFIKEEEKGYMEWPLFFSLSAEEEEEVKGEKEGESRVRSFFHSSGVYK